MPPKTARRGTSEKSIYQAPGSFSLDYLARTHYRDLDYGIRPVVKVLAEAGLRPFTSCSGHGRDSAYVVLHGRKRDARLAARAPQRAGYDEFKIAVERRYSRQWPEANRFRRVRVQLTVALCRARQKPAE